jgi:hypothetical protein
MQMTDFDMASFKQAVERHWRHHAICERVNWLIRQREDGVREMEVGPIFQQLDDKIVWTPFDFNVTGFSIEPGIEVVVIRASSYCLSCDNPPLIELLGAYHNQPFVMRMHLEPDPNSEPQEVIDTLLQQVTPIEMHEP